MDDFLCGFPPPPPFYKNYSLKCPDPDASLDAKLDSIKDQIKEAEGLVFDYSKLTCFEGPKPPSPPTESWSSFGNIHKVTFIFTYLSLVSRRRTHTGF